MLTFRSRVLIFTGIVLAMFVLGSLILETRYLEMRSTSNTRSTSSASTTFSLTGGNAPVTSSIANFTGTVSSINVTGHALRLLSGNQFVFSDGKTIYNVTMDDTTRCVNLRGKLLGGSQFVSRIIMITSLPITITGTLTGSTVKAVTVLIPTTKDAIT